MSHVRRARMKQQNYQKRKMKLKKLEQEKEKDKEEVVVPPDPVAKELQNADPELDIAPDLVFDEAKENTTK